jgi:ribonuclease HII
MRIADSRIRPTFELEAAEHQLGSRPIAGVDEAGRGPWAGPVVAAAVILNPDRIPANIDDSKVLDEDSRAYLYKRIMKVAIVPVGIADVDKIDRDNILGAKLWAMAEAVARLTDTPKQCSSTETGRRGFRWWRVPSSRAMPSACRLPLRRSLGR